MLIFTSSLVVDVDIQKPDTGYLSVIERPSSHPSSKFSTHAGPTPAKTPTATSSTGSGGTTTPIVPVAPYTEPLSEGEEDEDEIIAAKGEEDETKRTGLGAEEVKAAIAYREKMLKERREEEEEAKKREKRAGKDRDTGAVDVTLSASEIAHAIDEIADTVGEASVGKNGKQPQFFKEMSTISRKLRTSTLDINPLAPSSAFDETLKTKLAGAQESVESLRSRRKKHHSSSRQHSMNYGRRNDLVEDEEEGPDSADVENGLSGPSRQQTVDDMIVERNWRAPKGKKIAVPVRIEPKVYFAAERTFLVCTHHLQGILFLFNEYRPFPESFSFVQASIRDPDPFLNRNGLIMQYSSALSRRPFSISFRPMTQGDLSVRLCSPSLPSWLLPTPPVFLSSALTNSESEMQKGCTMTSTARLSYVAYCSSHSPQMLASDGLRCKSLNNNIL